MTSTETASDLVALAQSYGIATEFKDWKDKNVEVSDETLIAVLSALDVDASSPEAVASALHHVQHESAAGTLPPCIVTIEGEQPTVTIVLAEGKEARLDLVTEDGTTTAASLVEAAPAAAHPAAAEQASTPGTRVHALRIPTDLPLGYHTLTLTTGDAAPATSTLVVTPRHLGYPDSMGDRRIWGLATQLYSVRSHASWGVGDLVDLRDLAVWSAGEHGADYILVNPLHAAEPEPPMQPSPYLPTSRRFVNPLYLRVERIEEYASAPEDVRRRINDLAAAAHEELDGLDRIDRDTAWRLKHEALRLLWSLERTPAREIAFRTSCRDGGESLTRFAVWNVLATTFGPDWTMWPQEYQDPNSPAVARFCDEHADDIDFQRWLQWCLDDELRDVQSAACAAGMSLGVVHDLAVGVNPHGADAWALGDVFARGIHVGAPPDQFSQLGQDWGQPPLRPDRLAETAYRPFRDMVGTVLRHGGGVRVDHILGLFRLWWIPEGKDASHGTYVRYDYEAMIGILALEAHRAGALVVGEDLGTLEPWVQKYLASRGLLGTSILWFEQDWDAERPLPPQAWREMCLASVTTHDLPPTAGYLDGAHVRLRSELGLLEDSLEDEMARDEADRRRWREFLVTQGLLDDADAPNDEVVEALHAFLLTTPSHMLNIALVDAVGDIRTQNQPGTSDEYPNWRVPLAGPDGQILWLEDVFVSERAARLCRLFAHLNPS